jgi:hypothetical protein
LAEAFSLCIRKVEVKRRIVDDNLAAFDELQQAG